MATMKCSRRDVVVGLLLLLVAVTLPITGESSEDQEGRSQPRRRLLDTRLDFSRVDFGIGTTVKTIIKFFGNNFVVAAQKLTTWWISFKNVFTKNKFWELTPRSWRQWNAFFREAVVKGQKVTRGLIINDFYTCAKAGWSACREKTKANAQTIAIFCPVMLRWECEYYRSTSRRPWTAPDPWAQIG